MTIPPLPIDVRNAYEANFTAATTPMPVKLSGLDAAEVHEILLGSSQSRATRQIEIWAQNNDAPVLEHVLTSTWARCDRDIERPELVYALSHMLVDGSGNKDLAQRWMKKFDHTVELARKYLKEQWRDTSDDRRIDQARLGLGTVAQVFTILTYDDERVAPILQIMGYRDDNNGMDGKQAMGLAHLLRLTVPDGIPKISAVATNGQIVHKPLPEELFTYASLKVRHLLPSIQMAYGEEREDIRDMMRAGIHTMLDAGRLSMETRLDESHHWDALMTWGEEGLGAKIWHATVLPKLPFVHALFEKCTEEMAIHRLEQVDRLGADLQSPVRLKGSAENETVRIIDVAAAYAKPQIVGWLLGKGCDPTFESVDPKSGKTVSAQMLAAAKLAATPEGDPNREAAVRVCDLIAADLSRRAAHEAIAGMFDEPKGRVAP